MCQRVCQRARGSESPCLIKNVDASIVEESEFLRHDQFCAMDTLNTNMNTSPVGQELSFDPQ